MKLIYFTEQITYIQSLLKLIGLIAMQHYRIALQKSPSTRIEKDPLVEIKTCSEKQQIAKGGWGALNKHIKNYTSFRAMLQPTSYKTDLQKPSHGKILLIFFAKFALTGVMMILSRMRNIQQCVGQELMSSRRNSSTRS